MTATLPEDLYLAALLRNAMPNSGLHIAKGRVALKVSLSFFLREVNDRSEETVYNPAHLSQRPYRKESDSQRSKGNQAIIP